MPETIFLFTRVNPNLQKLQKKILMKIKLIFCFRYFFFEHLNLAQILLISTIRLKQSCLWHFSGKKVARRRQAKFAVLAPCCWICTPSNLLFYFALDDNVVSDSSGVIIHLRKYKHYCSNSPIQPLAFLKIYFYIPF